MRDIEVKIIKYGEFQKAINLELFHAMLAMIAHVSEKEEALRQWRGLRHSVIWWEKQEGYESYFSASGLRYPGEVLERYEEHFGSKIENLRAVALALGYAVPFLTPSMFVGRQKENFLRKLAKETKQDVYLLGARYLLESNASVQQLMLKEMTYRKYTRTEEAVFVLSLFLSHTEGFQAMQSQLVHLLGEQRTFSLFQNIGMLEWLIAEYGEEIRKYRRKDGAVLKALSKLAYMYVKEDSQIFSVLSKAGYSKTEIAYANSAMVWSDRIYDGLDEDGIVAEKIAAQCCVTLINCESSLAESLYAYLEFLFRRYREYKIKYEENRGIDTAIRSRIKPVLPQTVLWMLQNLEIMDTFDYRFDVFDVKWDLLAENLDARKYHELFTRQLLCQKDLSTIEAKRWLERYFQLTDKDYLSGFQNSWANSQESFALLVELKIIKLWNFFQKHKKILAYREEPSEEISYIWGYVRGIRSREAFEFIELFLKEYGIDGICTYFGSWKKIYESMVKNLERYHREDICIEFDREFLSVEEERQVFEWLDESVFRQEPSRYCSFAVAALKNGFVRELYTKEEWKEIFKELRSKGAVSHWDEKALKGFLFSQEDIEAENAVIEAQKAEAERRKEEAELNKIKESLVEHSDGTFTSLKEYFHDYRYWDRDKKKAFQVTGEYLAELVNTSNSACDAQEFGDFLYICMEGIRLNALPQTQVIQLLEKMIRRGYYVADAK